MKAIPRAQYMPAVFPPAMMLVNRARSSGVGNWVRSMTMISLKGSYFIVSWFILIVFSVFLIYCGFIFILFAYFRFVFVLLVVSGWSV